MKRPGIAALLLTAGAAVGCYRGSVYSQYTEIALSAAMRPEEGVPARVNFGYDRGAVAFVSKLDSGRHRGEAASVISKESVAVVTDPRDLDDTLLQVDAAFISGNAAVVAAIPANRPWKVVDASGNTIYSGNTTGSAGGRIATAMSTTDRYACAQLRDVESSFGAISARTDRDAVFDAAAAAMSPGFATPYAARRASLDAYSAFRVTSADYTKDEEPCGPRLLEIVEKLGAAQK